MKNELKRMALICLCLCGCWPALAQVPGYIPTQGLVACYPLNGNALDASGNGNDGTLMGVSTALDRFFQPASAYYFPNQPAAIDCGNDSSLNVNECTIAAWVRYSNTALPLQTIVAKADSDSTGAFVFSIVEDKMRIVFYYDSTEARLDCFRTLFPNVWTHLVVTHSTTYGINMYVDGDLAQSSPYTGNIRQGVANHHLRMGSRGAGRLDPILGARLDDVALWNRALGTEEIEAMYAAGLVGRDEELRAAPFSLFPNPATGIARLEVEPEWLGEPYSLLNALGQAIIGGEIGSQATLLNLESIQPGLYFLKVGAQPAMKLIVR